MQKMLQNIYSPRVCAYQRMCILFIQETLLQIKKNIMLNVTTIFQDEILRVNTYSLKYKKEKKRVLHAKEAIND